VDEMLLAQTAMQESILRDLEWSHQTLPTDPKTTRTQLQMPAATLFAD
jgi:hypothetical protein